MPKKAPFFARIPFRFGVSLLVFACPLNQLFPEGSRMKTMKIAALIAAAMLVVACGGAKAAPEAAP
ncbi:MAG: hypothetical protein J6Y56_08990, partial [Fibrobacterales bacterium]|nr:hypothetical protein [Fibrobacterales bacterium]